MIVGKTGLNFKIRNASQLVFPLTYSEEFFCWPWIQCSIGNFCLLGQVFCTFYGGDHSLHRQESSEVSGVRWYNDECEEPPDASDNPTWEGSEHGQDNARFPFSNQQREKRNAIDSQCVLKTTTANIVLFSVYSRMILAFCIIWCPWRYTESLSSTDNMENVSFLLFSWQKCGT